MKYLTRILMIGIIPLLLVILGWTNITNVPISSSDIIPISEIREDSDNPQKVVKIKGKISKIVPLVASFAYQVEDNTGKIWVVTKNQPPQVNQEIVVQGILQYQDITIGEEDFGDFYVLESNPNE